VDRGRRRCSGGTSRFGDEPDEEERRLRRSNPVVVLASGRRKRIRRRLLPGNSAVELAAPAAGRRSRTAVRRGQGAAAIDTVAGHKAIRDFRTAKAVLVVENYPRR